MGTHQSKIDLKGRVSIPASFRTVLRARSESGQAAMVLYPSHVYPCLEGYTVAEFEALTAKLDQLETFSADHDDMATAVYSDSWSSEADKEGRVILPDYMVAHAALSDGVCFVGLGRRFQIWEPQAAQARKAGARSGAASRGVTLPGTRA